MTEKHVYILRHINVELLRLKEWLMHETRTPEQIQERIDSISDVLILTLIASTKPLSKESTTEESDANTQP